MKFARLKMLAVHAVPAVALSLACGESGTDPTEPVVSDSAKVDKALDALTPDAAAYMRATWASFPDIVRSIWIQCATNQTIGMLGTAYKQGPNCRFATVDGYPRRYVVYVPHDPASISNASVPLVFMFHGTTGTGEEFYNRSGWREQGDESGFISAYPSGLTYLLTNGKRQTKWNSFQLPDIMDPSWRPEGYPATAPWPSNDVGFIDAILDDLEQRADIDLAQQYASGFSNGGQFASRLSVERSDRFAAIGVMSGFLGDVYQPVRRIPLIGGLGTLDDGVIESINASLTVGQQPIDRIPLDPDEFLSYSTSQAVVGAFPMTFGLEVDTYETELTTTRTQFDWATPVAGNTDGNVFRFHLFDDVIHQYPRGVGRDLGPNNVHEFDAPRMFWEFFRTH